MHGFRVLIVEDTRSIRKIIRQGIEKEYPEVYVEEAANGKDAQQILLRRKFDLILCDFDMPQLNGHELLLWIKEKPHLQSIPFIMVTAMRERQSILEILKAGASAVLFKPFTIEALCQKIGEVTNVANMRKHDRYPVKGTALFKMNDLEFKGAMVDLSNGGLCCDVSHHMPIPRMLEKVSGEVHLACGRQLHGLSAQVIRMHIASDFSHSGNVRIAMIFQDMPDEAMQAVESYTRDRHLEALALQNSAA